MKITQTDLLAALREALEKPAGEGVTVAELTGIMQCGENKVRKTLRVVMVQGRLECLKVFRPAINGDRRQVPAYRIKK